MMHRGVAVKPTLTVTVTIDEDLRFLIIIVNDMLFTFT